MTKQIDCKLAECNDKAEQNAALPKRGKSELPLKKQLITFSVAEKRVRVRHRSPESAERERVYLQAKTGKQMKVIMIPGFTINDLINGRVVIIKDGEIFKVPKAES